MLHLLQSGDTSASRVSLQAEMGRLLKCPFDQPAMQPQMASLRDGRQIRCLFLFLSQLVLCLNESAPLLNGLCVLSRSPDGILMPQWLAKRLAGRENWLLSKSLSLFQRCSLSTGLDKDAGQEKRRQIVGETARMRGADGMDALQGREMQ